MSLDTLPRHQLIVDQTLDTVTLADQKVMDLRTQLSSWLQIFLQSNATDLQGIEVRLPLEFGVNKARVIKGTNHVISLVSYNDIHPRVLATVVDM